MISITPTILAANQSDFAQFMEVYKPFASRIQIDICDGMFAPNRTLDIAQITIPEDYKGKIDLHMMVKRPSNYLQQIIAMKPNLVIFHAECDENLLPVFQQLEESGINTGVAILKTTYPGDIRQYIEVADHALIFAGTLGRQGGNADLLQLEKVGIIKSIDSKIEIGWDGGANMDNVRTIAHSGIDVINIGSAISQSKNAKEAYDALEAEADKQGVHI